MAACIPSLYPPDARAGTFDKEEVEHQRRSSEWSQPLNAKAEMKYNEDLPISHSEYYQKRQRRFSLPDRIVSKLGNEPNAMHSAPDRGAEMMDLLILANQIRWHCQMDDGRIKSAKHLKQKMIELIHFTEHRVDELWSKSKSDEIEKAMASISESLRAAKRVLEEASRISKVRFGRRRNSRLNASVQTMCDEVGIRMAFLERACSGEHAMSVDFEVFPRAPARGELLCLDGHRAFFGHGMKRDLKRALASYRAAAALGDGDGMNHLAMMLEKGIGCTPSVGEAVVHYEAAVRLQHEDARFHLANLLRRDPEHGDIRTAIELYQTAAGHDHVGAQTTLGGLYEVGIENQLEPDIPLSVESACSVALVIRRLFVSRSASKWQCILCRLR